MPALPALPDLSGDFYLPLSEGTARRLVTNMLAGEHATEFSANDLLTDPAIVCWALCRWRRKKPPTLAKLASLINEHNWIRAFSADVSPLAIATGESKVERCRKLTKRAYRRAVRRTGATTTAAETVAALVQDAVKWFKAMTPDNRTPLPRSMPDLSKFDGRDQFSAKRKLADDQKTAIKQTWLESQDWGRVARQLARTLSRADQLEHRFENVLNQEKIRAMRELAYGASHEINNPLANISTRAQMLMRDEPDPDRQRNLAAIAHQAFRAHEMITDMMLFAKPPSISVRATALSSILKKCYTELADEFHQPHRVNWRIDSSCKKYDVLADRSALVVALKAIFQNSLEAIDEDGIISVRASMEKFGDTVLVRISDSGPGIPEAIRRRIFDPFFSGREAGRGLGFGLPKAWQIIRLHGGQLTLEKRKNQTEFVARLKSASSRD